MSQLVFDKIDIHGRGVNFFNQSQLFYCKRLMFGLHLSLTKLGHDIDLSKSLAFLDSFISELAHSYVTPNPIELALESFFL